MKIVEIMKILKIDKISILLITALVVSLVGCSNDEHGKNGDNGKAESPILVSGLITAPVATEKVETLRRLAGTVRAASISHVSARIMAQVLTVNVQEGQLVKAGDLLVVLDDREFRSKVRAAKGGLRQAQAQLELATVTHERYKALLDGKAVSRQEYDAVLAKQKMAKETVAQASSALEEARTYLGFTEIRSPVTGQVVAKNIDAGSMANPGMPLISIEPEGAYRLELPVDVSLSNAIQKGTRLKVEIESVFEGVVSVTKVVPMVDPVSRTFLVKSDLPAKPGVFKSGQYAMATISLGTKEATVIPVSAIVRRGQLDGVYVVQDPGGILKYRIIKVGREASKDRIEVLTGLTPGEQIVVKGVDRARDGVRVEPEKGGNS